MFTIQRGFDLAVDLNPIIQTFYQSTFSSVLDLAEGYDRQKRLK